MYRLFLRFLSYIGCYRVLNRVACGMGFSVGSAGKESASSEGDTGSIPGLGISPGEGNDYPFWYSCLENPMDRGAWHAALHGVSKSWTQTEQLKRLSTNAEK